MEGFVIVVVGFVFLQFWTQNFTHIRQGLSHWDTSPAHDGCLLCAYWLPAHPLWWTISPFLVFIFLHFLVEWFVSQLNFGDSLCTRYTNPLFNILFASFSPRIYLPLYSLNKHVYLLGFNFPLNPQKSSPWAASRRLCLCITHCAAESWAFGQVLHTLWRQSGLVSTSKKKRSERGSDQYAILSCQVWCAYFTPACLQMLVPHSQSSPACMGERVHLGSGPFRFHSSVFHLLCYLLTMGLGSSFNHKGILPHCYQDKCHLPQVDWKPGREDDKAGWSCQCLRAVSVLTGATQKLPHFLFR